MLLTLENPMDPMSALVSLVGQKNNGKGIELSEQLIKI